MAETSRQSLKGPFIVLSSISHSEINPYWRVNYMVKIIMCSWVVFTLWLCPLEGPPPSSQINAWSLIFTYKCLVLVWLFFLDSFP